MLPSESIERSQQAGFIGGTLTGFFVNISMADVFATILLSAIGAVVSFLVSMLMRRLLRERNKERPHPD
jgi:dolichol kinase